MNPHKFFSKGNLIINTLHSTIIPYLSSTSSKPTNHQLHCISLHTQHTKHHNKRNEQPFQLTF